ncbi:MAG: class I SAM-dependent methyltransferase [Crocinitomicaceae bacterium]
MLYIYNWQMNRIDRSIEDLVSLGKNTYCDLGPGEGILSVGLKNKGKQVVAVEAPWAREENKSWAKVNNVPIHFIEFFTGDFSQITEDVDCFILAHAIAHFRFSPYILLEKIYNKLPSGGYFYLSTVNGCSFERVLQLFRGQNIVQKVTKDLDPGFKEVVVDFNRTDQRQIWDDWMHVKEYTKPELEEMFQKSGFEIHSSFYRNNYPHWKKNMIIKFYPHLAEEIIIIGKKP